MTFVLVHPQRVCLSLRSLGFPLCSFGVSVLVVLDCVVSLLFSFDILVLLLRLLHFQ